MATGPPAFEFADREIHGMGRWPRALAPAHVEPTVPGFGRKPVGKFGPVTVAMGLQGDRGCLSARTIIVAHIAGKQVFHTKFGEGKVLAVEGTGADARAQVNFPRHGVKWLALSVAKLTVV